MTTTCDFDVAVRIIADDGTTVRVNLNDPSAGLSVVTLDEPEDSQRVTRVSAPRVDGSYRVAEADADGLLVVLMDVDGTSWAQVETRWQAVRTAYRAESLFYVETEIEGVTKWWRAERPDVTPAGTESASLVSKIQTYTLRFQVQPNPVVTIA